MLTRMEILSKIREHNIRYGVRVPCPYKAVILDNFYPDQVKCLAGIYYYQLPKSQQSRVVAWWRDDGKGEFNWDGVELPRV